MAEEGEVTAERQTAHQEKPLAPRPARILPRCANLADFDILEKVGEGTFGEVYKAKQKKTGKLVALKKILSRVEQEGFPITAMREIKLLKHLKHQNVIDLLDMAVQYSGETVIGVYMVFVFMDHDLHGLLANAEAAFDLPQIKCYLRQLLKGVDFLHTRHILHRDIKASNVLINNRGDLRITDFGLARPLEEGRTRYTPGVVTRWYRPPELLLGACEYDQSVDLWGVGCILVELLWRKSAFPGEGDFDQLELISKLCGTPSKENMPNWGLCPLFEKVKLPVYKRSIREQFKGVEGDLIDKLLVLDPKQRLSAAQALQHPFFTTEPLPASPKDLPSYTSSHEYTTSASGKKDPFDASYSHHHPNRPSEREHPTPNRPTTHDHRHPPHRPTERDDRHRHYRSRSPRRHLSRSPRRNPSSEVISRSHNPHGRQLSSYADMYDDDDHQHEDRGRSDRRR